MEMIRLLENFRDASKKWLRLQLAHEVCPPKIAQLTQVYYLDNEWSNWRFKLSFAYLAHFIRLRSRGS